MHKVNEEAENSISLVICNISFLESVLYMETIELVSSFVEEG